MTFAAQNLLLPLFALLAGGGAVAPSSSVPASTASAIPAEPERWDWEGAVSGGKGVRIENNFGDVRARFGGGDGKVEIHAVIQNLTAGIRPLRVLTKNEAAGLAIEVSREGGGEEEKGAARRSDRIDLAVFIPKGAPVSILTKSGDIEVRGLKSDVRLETVTGNISLRSIEGLVSTKTSYGTTLAMLDRPADHSNQSFESLTGDITVSFHPAAEPLIHAETSGEIGTEFSVEIVRHPHEEPDKTATAKIGRGTSTASIRSRRGTIHIQQRLDLR